IADDASVMRLTWDHYVSYIKGNGVSKQLGGGMIGGMLLALSSFLFSTAGSKIIAITAIVIGILFMTTFSLGKLILDLKERIEETAEKAKAKKVEHDAKKQAKEAKTKIIEQKESKEEEQDVDVQFAYSDNGQLAIPVEEEKEEDQEKEASTKKNEKKSFQKTKNDYQVITTIYLLKEPVKKTKNKEPSQISPNAKVLEDTFESFGVKAKITKAHVGPAVTKYE